MGGKGTKAMSILLAMGTLSVLPENTVAKDNYYMDSSLDCGYLGVQEISRNQTVRVHAKTTDTSAGDQLGCTIHFRTVDNDATVRIDFESFIVGNCDVKLYISGDGSGKMSTYSCSDNPSTYFSIGRTVTLTLHRTAVEATRYNFRLKLVAVRDDRYPLPGYPPTRYPVNSYSNSVAVGLVISIFWFSFWIYYYTFL